MAQKYTIGRHATNSIVVSSSYPHVSGQHATFWVSGSEVLFEDHSRNGSSVNGHPVHNARYYLQKGDELILAGSYRVDLQSLPFVCGQDPLSVRSSQLPQYQGTARKVNVSHGAQYADAVEHCLPFVYFLQEQKRVVKYRGKELELDGGATATGFLLSDGRFVTARHVVEPWMFIRESSSETDRTLNQIATHGGSVVSYLRAYNCNGDVFDFTTRHMVMCKDYDREVEIGEEKLVLACPAHDWAYCRIRRTGGLSADADKSVALKMLTKLTVLGFPFGFGANAADDIQPIYGSAVVAKTGLDNGVILTTEDSTDPGNSGGPVFYTRADGTLRVIGVVSAGRGSHIGMAVPIINLDSK